MGNWATPRTSKDTPFPNKDIIEREVKNNLDYLKTEADKAILKDGSVDFTADQSMGSYKLTDLAAPTADNDAARKVDISIGCTQNDVTSSRAYATNYQNSTKTRIITVRAVVYSAGGFGAYVSSFTPPTSPVGYVSTCGLADSSQSLTLTFVVPPSYYYKLYRGGAVGQQQIFRWMEWDLG